MRTSRFDRFAPLAGIAFFLLIVAAIIIGGETPTVGEDSRRETIDFWRDNDDAQVISAVLGVYAGFFLVWFAAGLRSAFDRAGIERDSVAARVSWAGALILAAGLFVALGLAFAVGDAADDVSGNTLFTLAVLTDGFFLPFPPGMALFLTGSGAAALATGVLPRWMGIAAILLGILCLIPYAGFFALVIGILWIALSSILLWRRGGAAPAAVAEPLGPPE